MTEDLQPVPSGGDTDLSEALRRTATGLIKDLRALGFRNQSENYSELLRAERAAVQGLLESADPQLAERGLQALHAIESERRKLAELELAHAKTGMEAFVYYQLGRLRMQAEAGDQGPSPENVSREITRMVNDLREKADPVDSDPGASPEPTDEPSLDATT